MASGAIKPLGGTTKVDASQKCRSLPSRLFTLQGLTARAQILGVNKRDGPVLPQAQNEHAYRVPAANIFAVGRSSGYRLRKPYWISPASAHLSVL